MRRNVENVEQLLIKKFIYVCICKQDFENYYYFLILKYTLVYILNILKSMNK